jgi:hypothetical protein
MKEPQYEFVATDIEPSVQTIDVTALRERLQNQEVVSDPTYRSKMAIVTLVIFALILVGIVAIGLFVS